MEATKAAREQFLKVVNDQFQEHCKSREIEPSAENFLDYMLNRSLIPDKIIKRLVVITAYPQALNNLGIKKLAVWEIENKYDIPEPTARYYLAKHVNDFKPKR